MERAAILHPGPVLTDARRDLAVRLRAAFAAAAPRGPGRYQPVVSPLPDRLRGDHDLNPDLLPEITPRQAAVLVPIILHDDGASVLLTVRAEGLSHHGGQVSFPGGRIDPTDRDPIDAALREFEEELGAPRQAVQVIGALDRYLIARSAFEVTPVVGLIEPPLVLCPDPGEVAEVFELKLDRLLGAQPFERHARDWRGQRREYYALDVDGHHVWGATAGMLVNLRDVLLATPGP